MNFTIPMLRDRHSHPLLYASWMDGKDLRWAESLEQTQDLIRDCEFVDGEILVAHGWLDSKFSVSSMHLEEFPPVAVFNLSLHGLAMNRAAKELVEEELQEIDCPWNDQFWFEKNLRRILNAFAMLNSTKERLTRFFQWLEMTHGVIYAEEMLLAGEKEIELFCEADLLDRTQFWCSMDMWNQLSTNSKNQIEGIKIFADGALGVRTAAVHHPFDNGDRGMLMYSDSQLTTLLSSAAETEKSIAIHAIGDRAIDQVVGRVEKLRKRNDLANQVRIEHAQLISFETAKKAKSNGIILSMQPNFSVDSREYSDRLPEHYCRGNNPFRMLIDEVGFIPGEDLIFGSDGMPHGIQEAITQSVFPPFPERQRLTIEELVAGYCDETVYESDTEVEISIDNNESVTFSF